MVESLNSPRCGLLGMEELSRAKCVAFLGGSARAKFVTCFCKLLSCVDQKKSRAMGRREGREHTIIIHRKWLLGSVSPGETWENPASGAPVRVNGLAKCWEVSEPKW